MKKDFCVFLDAGHGALDENGKYYVLGGGKKFDHQTGNFHDGSIFYEGVFNRIITQKVSFKLDQLQIPHIDLHHAYLDYPLAQRVEKANYYDQYFKKSLLLSSHANAFNSKVRGYEVFTSKGKTASDGIATNLFTQTQKLLGDQITYRKGLDDGDVDKEKNFYILKMSSMPAVLIEHLFFDNLEDAQLLMKEDIQDLFAEAQVRVILDYFL